MSNLLTSAGLAACLAALVTSLLMPLIAQTATRIGAMDYPGERRRQLRPTPRMGGVAIVLGFCFGAGFVLLVSWSDRLLEVGRGEILSIGFATVLVFLVGLVDDLVGVSVIHKFLAQFAAAWLVVKVGWVFEAIRLPFIGSVELGALQEVGTILWIVGVTNAINFIDGLDGLAGGVVAIVASSFLVVALMQGRILPVVWIAAIVGACLGFLRFNWAPARIFMGDSGALTLGFLLATISVHSSLKAPVAVAILVPILALGVPVIDALLVMRLRFLNPDSSGLASRFLQMFRADQRHLHHVLLHQGASRRRIITGIYALVMVSCFASLLVAVQRNPNLGVLLVAVEFLAVVMLRHLGIGRDTRETTPDEPASSAGPAARRAGSPRVRWQR